MQYMQCCKRNIINRLEESLNIIGEESRHEHHSLCIPDIFSPFWTKLWWSGAAVSEILAFGTVPLDHARPKCPCVQTVVGCLKQAFLFRRGKLGCFPRAALAHPASFSAKKTGSQPPEMQESLGDLGFDQWSLSEPAHTILLSLTLQSCSTHFSPVNTTPICRYATARECGSQSTWCEYSTMAGGQTVELVLALFLSPFHRLSPSL